MCPAQLNEGMLGRKGLLDQAEALGSCLSLGRGAQVQGCLKVMI